MWGSGEAFLCDRCRSRTSIFEVFAILGYVFHFCFHYMLHLQLFYFFCTPIFHNFKMSGYARPNFNLFYTTYSLCSLKMYPDISFFLFFEVHIPQLLFILHNIWFVFVKNVPRHFIFLVFWGTHSPTAAHFTQHMVCTHKKTYPDISSFHFLRYACPNHHSFHITNI